MSGLSMFVRIVEEGSLSAAGAGRSGCPGDPQPQPRRSSEKRLGAPLLIRSTRTRPRRRMQAGASSTRSSPSFESAAGDRRGSRSS